MLIIKKISVLAIKESISRQKKQRKKVAINPVIKSSPKNEELAL